MSEEKKNLEDNKLTDDQVEQVSGGRRRPRAATHDLIEKETGKSKSTGTRFTSHGCKEDY